MKRIIIFFLMLGASSFSYAAEINSGQFNVKTHKVELKCYITVEAVFSTHLS